MFGYKRGAHNQAAADKDGLVTASTGGTLFLDEIGDMPPSIQATLLRTLQDGVVRPVGSTRGVQVDLRVLCATHVDVPLLVKRERFREDLWARVSAHVLRLPAVRDRREDLGLLVRDILARDAGDCPTLSVEVVAALLAYDWPRNVRQLEQVLQRARTLASRAEITVQHLPAEVLDAASDEKDRLVDLLRRHQGDLQAAAAEEGVTRQAIAKRCDKHAVDYKAFRPGGAPLAETPPAVPGERSR